MYGLQKRSGKAGQRAMGHVFSRWQEPYDCSRDETEIKVGSKGQKTPSANLAGLDPLRKHQVLTRTAAWTSLTALSCK